MDFSVHSAVFNGWFLGRKEVARSYREQLKSRDPDSELPPDLVCAPPSTRLCSPQNTMMNDSQRYALLILQRRFRRDWLAKYLGRFSL
jgi:hypothetical protein